jgi:Spy/CpxP family protein refolding chaperone
MHTHRIHGARRLALVTGLLTALVLVATPAWAQDSTRMRKHTPEEHVAKLQEELDLTAEQTEQIRAILAEQHAKFQELRGEDGDRESKREAFGQHREETHARIREVLNEEQRARLEELHAEFKERHGHGPGGHGDHRPKDAPDNR